MASEGDFSFKRSISSLFILESFVVVTMFLSSVIVSLYAAAVLGHAVVTVPTPRKV
jgi:hypothetical protein